MISTCWILKSIQIGLCICCDAADNSKICFVSNIFLRHITNQSNCSTLENYFNHYIFHSIEIAKFRKKIGLSYSISSIQNIPSIEMQFQNMLHAFGATHIRHWTLFLQNCFKKSRKLFKATVKEYANTLTWQVRDQDCWWYREYSHTLPSKRPLTGNRYLGMICIVNTNFAPICVCKDISRWGRHNPNTSNSCDVMRIGRPHQQ